MICEHHWPNPVQLQHCTILDVNWGVITINSFLSNGKISVLCQKLKSQQEKSSNLPLAILRELRKESVGGWMVLGAAVPGVQPIIGLSLPGVNWHNLSGFLTKILVNFGNWLGETPNFFSTQYCISKSETCLTQTFVIIFNHLSILCYSRCFRPPQEHDDNHQHNHDHHYHHNHHQDVLDVELCTYALTLVNKTLYEIDDQPTFYDQTDYMEDLGIDRWYLWFWV